ncbi:MAG: M48 family metallopeptidase [Aliishimia sp.]
MQTTGRYFDGEAGQRFDVEVAVEPNQELLILSHPDLPADRIHWPLDALRALRDGARNDQITLSLRAARSDDSALIDVARLTISDEIAIEQLKRFTPNLMKRDLPKGTAWRITSRIGLAVGALVAMIFVILPAMANTLADIIPIEREIRWGKSIVAQMERFLGASELGELACSSPEGDAALAVMVDRLTHGTKTVYDLDVAVFDHEMVNAFAAPGGQVVLMRGLIDEAGSADEVAAVLGHEIGHVEARDATRNTLRATGSAGLLSLVLGDFTGGSIAVLLAEATLSASYTREAEEAADVFALEMLDTANVSTNGMAQFFDTIGKSGGHIHLPEYLSSHPATDGRAEAARDFATGQGETSPILADAEWQALQAICD